MPLLGSGVLKPAFQQTLKSYFWVSNNITLYFAFYFFLLASLFIVKMTFWFPADWFPADSFPLLLFVMVALFLARIFLAFMVPYYAFRYNEGSAPAFWHFIGDKVWPLVLNRIKAIFVILFFLLLLILPGIYKAIRLFFLTETVFFDKKEGSGFLKKTSQTSKGFFWFCFFIIIFFLLFGSIPDFVYTLADTSLENLLSPALQGLVFIPFLIFGFYIKIFAILFKNNLYFQIKKAKNEEFGL